MKVARPTHAQLVAAGLRPVPTFIASQIVEASVTLRAKDQGLVLTFARSLASAKRRAPR